MAGAVYSFNPCTLRLSLLPICSINITDDDRGYYYLFDPCRGYHCPGYPGVDTAVS